MMCQLHPHDSGQRLSPHHAANDVGPGALLVDQGEGGVEVVGDGRRATASQNKQFVLERGY